MSQRTSVLKGNRYMKTRITLQLELKDIFFHRVERKPITDNYLELNGRFYIKREYLVEFIQLLSPHFNFSIWSVYTEEECKYFADYLTSIGAYILYYRNDCYKFPLENGEWSEGKRLKRLTVTNTKIDKLICIESSIPIHDNHNNYFIIPAFSGEEDEELLESAIKLLDLEDVEDTTKINNF